MSEPSRVTIRIPQPKTTATVCASIAGLLLLVLIPLAASPMKVVGGDCGTIFASSDTWKYDSYADAANDIARKSVRSSADLDDFASSLVDNMMSDLALGSAIYDQCEDRHEGRLIWISVVGIAAILFGAAAFYFRRQSRAVGGD